MATQSDKRRRGWIIVFVLILIILAAAFIFARQWLLQLPSVQQQNSVRKRRGGSGHQTREPYHLAAGRGDSCSSLTSKQKNR